MRKRCIRKIFKLVNPIALAMEGAAICTEATLNRVRLKELAAIEAFRSGQATKHDWHAITAMVNLTESMALDGIGPEALGACTEAQRHLRDAVERFRTTGRMGTTGPGLQSFRDVYEYHDLQRQSVSRSTYEQAIRKLSNLVTSRHPKVQFI